ncbi:MAG: HNH endonuclease [Gammaproteobacteria bacterium]|nr:MAG: HNH endonuclease [Gammaproteobacteria bacterium]
MKVKSNLTADQVRELFDYDGKDLIWRISRGRVNAGDIANSKINTGYLRVGVNNLNYQVHRLIWLHEYGVWPSNEIDHINGVKDDNRLENLREVTHRENQENQKLNSNNTSGVVGVSFRKDKNKWVARLFGCDISKFLGYFDTLFDAACARKSAEIEHSYHPNHGRLT